MADDGFLVDPESEYAKYHDTDVVSFDQIKNKPCLVLLGEPGIGKSTAVKAEFESVKQAISGTNDLALWFDLRDYSSDDRLERRVFRCQEVEEWRRGHAMLHLFLDSLDEALLRIDNISRVLLSEIAELPNDRLRFRLASRPADWPGALEDGLNQLWKMDRLPAFELAPLRRVDVISAAQLSGAPSEAFIDALLQADVVPLAIKPVTLKFLIAAFQKGKALPARRQELYFQGCRRLCEEPNSERLESPRTRPQFAVGQRLAIASRIAAVTQISNRASIWLGAEEGLDPEDVPLELLIGGTEGEPLNEVTVDLSAVREVLNTGLFSSRGLGRQGWQHQTYAEYLAALYLNGQRDPLGRFRSLILHPDGSGKVVPQLREVAAWLAGMNSRVFDLLVRSDPEVLLLANMTGSSHSDRAALAKRLLEFFEEGKISQSLWDIRAYFSRLTNPALADITESYVSGPPRSESSRIAAIEMIRACRLTSLQEKLAALALDPDETYGTRVHAASTIVEIGDENHRGALRPLALASDGDDPKDDLKGYGLIAAWPDHISAGELFWALTPPKQDNYFGSYRRFLDSDVAGQLSCDDVITALAWAGQYTAGRDGIDKLRDLSTKILEAAIDCVDEPGVLDALVPVLAERQKIYTDQRGFTAKLLASPEAARRAVARAMFSTAAIDRHGAFAIIDICGIGGSDVPWLLSEFPHASSDGVKHLIAELITWILDPEDVDVFAVVLATAAANEYLHAAIQRRVAPIFLDTPLANELRRNHQLAMVHKQPRTVVSSVPVAQRLSGMLTGNNPAIFAQVYWTLESQKDRSPESSEPLPGWSGLESSLRYRILEASREYVRFRPPTPPGRWWREGTSNLGMSAGYRAFSLLASESPDSLDQFSDGDWQFWTRIVLVNPTLSSEDPVRSLLLAKAYEQAPDVFSSTFSEVIDGEDARYGSVPIVGRMGDLWSDELAGILHSKLRVSTLQPRSFRDLLNKLLKMAHVESKTLARRMATSEIPAGDKDREKAVLATVELLSHDPSEWRNVWAAFQKNDSFGLEVLQVTACEQEYTSFATTIDEDDIADLCIWLCQHGAEKTTEGQDEIGFITPPVALAHWWNTLINSLSYKGTVKSCHALERLATALPQYKGLQHSLREAEERTRRSTWAPPKPEEVMHVAHSNRAAHTVISVHGIRTRGAWQKKVNSCLQENGFRHEILDYGFFGAVQLLVPYYRARQIEWFVGEYEKLVANVHVMPSVVAHSFGTYIIASALNKYAEIRFDRIILCGSIVSRGYDWDSLLKGGRVKAVLNEYGGRDMWPRIAE